MSSPLDVKPLDFASAPPAAEWNALLARGMTDVVFLTREYQEAWWQSLGANQDGCCRLTILGLYEGGSLVGLAPFYLAPVRPADLVEEAERRVESTRVQAFARHDARAGHAPPPAEPAIAASALPVPAAGERMVRLGGGVAVTDYLDLICPPDRARAAWRAVLDYWAARAEEWDVIDLHSLPPKSPSRAIVLEEAQARAWEAWSEIEETCPALKLPAHDWEAYLSHLSKKDRHELRRKMRRAESAPEPPAWRLVTDPAALPAALDEFIALHKRSGAAKAAFMGPLMEDFFHRLLTGMAHTDWPEIALLDLAGTPVAAYLSFNYHGRIYLYNSGYDPAHHDLGTGFVLLVHRIAAAVEAGTPAFDFLRGDERYKYNLGGHDHYLHRVVVRRTPTVQDLH